MLALGLSVALFLFWDFVGLGLVTALHARRSWLQNTLLAPMVGLAATLLPIFWLNRMGLPVRSFAVPMAVGLLLLSAVLLLARRPRLPWREYLPFVAVFALVLVLTGRPMFQFGFEWLSYSNDDMANYSLYAERMLNYGFYDVPDAEQILHAKDFSQFYWFFDLGNRPGAEMVLSWVSAVTGLNPHQAYMSYILALQLVLISVSGALVCQTRRYALAALLTCALLALSALTSLGTLYQLIGQVGGLALLTGAATLVLRPLGEVVGWLTIRHAILFALVASGLLIWYPEIVPFVLLAAGLYAAVALLQRRLSLRPLLVTAAVAAVIAGAFTNTYLVPALLWLRRQAGDSLDASDSAVTLFPYYLLPSGLANLWGFQPIAPLTGEPWLSTSIVLGALLLVALSVAAFWQLWKLNPSATVLVVMLLLAARLVQQRSDFGLFKLAMFAQPFLIGTLVVSWLALVERRWFRYAPLVLLAIAGLPAQTAYVERSQSGAGSGLSEIGNASNGINSEFARIVESLPARNLVSDTSNVVLAKFQALYGKGRNVTFPTQDLFYNIAAGVPELELVNPELAATTNGLVNARTERIAQLAFDFQSPNPESTITTFDFDRYGQPPSVNSAETALVATTSQQSLMNRRTEPRVGNMNFNAYPWTEAHNHLIFISSSLGRHYYSAEKFAASFYQLEPDVYFQGETMAGLGRYLLFQAVNPSPQVRVVLNLSSTLKADGENELPPAMVVGKERELFPLVGRGSARVFSPPITPQIINGMPYIALDMGVEGQRIPEYRTGLMNLFGTDVARDWRRMVVFGRDISLIPLDDHDRLSPPAFIRNFPSDLAHPDLQYSGIYEDGWVAEHAYFDLAQPSAPSTVTVRGAVPVTSDPGFSTELRVIVDDKEATRQVLYPGTFEVNALLPVGGQQRVQLQFSRGQHLPGRDNRVAAAKLSFVGFDLMSPSAVEPSPQTVPEIALRSEGFALGRNWYGLETMGGETFRWVANDAELLIAPHGATARDISLELEPGPGVASQSFALDVFDVSGQKVATTEAQGRRKLTIPIPRDAASQQVLRLHVDGGGLPTPNDPRTLNFRVFRVSWASDAGRYDAQTLSKLNASADIGPADARQALVNGDVAADGLYLGQGWYPYETFQGQSFRWVADDAEVVVTSPSGAKQDVRFEVEPGPGVGSQPFSLQVLDENNQLVASVPVRGRQFSSIVLPIKANTPTVFKLHVDGGGLPTPNDPRVLNFRIFGFGWADTEGSEGR